MKVEIKVAFKFLLSFIACYEARLGAFTGERQDRF
jgi:hypothetical protein